MECKFRHTERAGLYIMVALCLLGSCYNISANREQVVPVINSIDSRLKTVQSDIWELEIKLDTHVLKEE